VGVVELRRVDEFLHAARHHDLDLAGLHPLALVGERHRRLTRRRDPADAAEGVVLVEGRHLARVAPHRFGRLPAQDIVLRGLTPRKAQWL